MTLTTLLLAALPLTAAQPTTPDLLAIKVGKAETIDQGTLEHAVILIEDGKIVMIGEDLPIERGIPVLDRDPEWTVMPGLVNAYSRGPLDSRGGNDSTPGLRASGELYIGEDFYGDVLELGVTTLGLYPAGNGIPGRAVAIRTKADTAEGLILRDDAYLKIRMRSSGSDKKMLKKGFEDADGWIEKEAKAREKWEKEQEKAKKSKKGKKDDEKEEDKSVAVPVEPSLDDEESGDYVAPEKDPAAEAFLQLRAHELSALVAIGQSSDYLHLIDAIGAEEFDWDLRIPITTELDIFNVKREIGLRACRVVMEPQLSQHPNTLRLRNLPMELAESGAKLVLIPRDDSVVGHEAWLRNTGEMVGYGLDRDAALRALTLEPAELLKVADRLGSLTVGKDANMIFFEGDPLEPGTRVEAVMLEGEFVTGEVKL
ncbi:MAG: amidohydrolase family protein [Planctomycetes bacterium]|nr:amidohydrolase family protein [Planctomycetota bacterium]MCB9902785.1 amidohydrolase family protein [Planctomycetota bacterium]